MKRIGSLWLIAAVLFALLPGGSPSEGATPDRTNIVVILVDDLGWADLGCYGSRFYRTPHLDRLASRGVRFANAYAAGPVCSPTRASLLTGKHPARLHLTDWLPGRQDRPAQKLLKPEIERRLPLEAITIAEALKPAGYVSGHIGKWHLGGRGSGPEQQGFDLNVAGDEAGSPLSYFAPFRSGNRVVPGLESSRPGEYLTDRLTDEAERFIETNRDRPFFLYLAHFAVHIPLAAKEEMIARYQAAPKTGPQTNAIYAAMIESVDQSVGRLVRKLEDLGLSSRTAIVFTSDNGGLSVEEGPHTPATSNAPLRDGKGYLSEGGIRVPLIVRWPARGGEGRVDSTPVSTVDFFPTILAMAGVALPGPVDGVNLLPLLHQGGSLGRDALYWHYPHYSNQGGLPCGAIREGEYKLIQFFEDSRIELYQLTVDPGERTNLVARLPAQAESLRAKLKAWRRNVGAQMMEANPDYQPPQGTAGDRVSPQMADGTILLHARDAVIHGSTVRYEPQPFKNTIGYWTHPEDWVSWEFDVQEPGRFRVEALQGCGTGSGGSEVIFAVDNQELKMVVRDTGGFQNFIARDLGEVHLDRPGKYRLSVKPQSKPGLAVMDLRAVTLKAVAER